MSRNRAKARRAEARRGEARRSRHREPAPPAPRAAPALPASISNGLPLWAAAALAAAIAGVIALRFAEPILDGDLYWHLAYARQMLERGTLVPDHTLYSWTPTNGAYIYCAWLSEFLLHALHQLGDLPALFALRYLVVGAGAALLMGFAWRLGLARRLPVYFVILLAVLASHAGTLIKPELVSFLLFHLVVFVYFRAKQADAAAPGTTRLFLWVPAIVLVWVNAHGGFVMAAPFLAATALGEALNRRFAPASALSRTAFRRMLAAWALCGLAILATPYGWRYPAQLVSEYLIGGARADFVWNAAHLSIFDARAAGLHLVEYGAAMLAILGVLHWRALRAGGRIDFGVVLANLAFLPLFAIYLRTSYFWPILFAYSALHLASRPYARTERAAERPAFARAVAGALLALFVVFAARSAFEARYRPSLASWMGFGPGYINPVAEAEFLARSDLGPRLYNIFDSGGYLLWRLHPKYKVMTDSRSFPYLGWFAEQFAFANGDGFAAFLRRYPADTAVIDLAKPGAWRHFLAAPEWRLVFYGPTAAIFVRASEPERRAVERTRFDALRNGATASLVFDFAAAAGDHATGWAVLALIESRFPGHVEPRWLAAARALRDGHAALARGDFAAARPLFAAATRERPFGARDAAIIALLERWAVPGAGVEAGKRADLEAELRGLAAR